jgi:uncharacterized protein (TIGR03435 family)
MVNGTLSVGSHGGPGTADPGQMNWTNITLVNLLVQAYDVKPSQIVGGPAWLDRDRFDILAKLPAGATRSSVRPMLRNLLESRFKLQTHREKKEMPIYALVAGRRTKMQEAGNEPAPNSAGPGSATSGADGCYDLALLRNRPGIMFSVMNGNACLTVSGQTMAAFAGRLSAQLDRPVVDATGLESRYEFQLRYDSASAGKGIALVTGVPASGPDIAPDPDRAPSIFTAVQEQLGLRLESRKGPVEVLIIDRIERAPTGN